MTPGTLKTILNSAPMIIQGATKLIEIIREREQKPENDGTTPVTTEGLKTDIHRLEQQLDANAESDVEQIKLIEQLAKQNETLAATLDKTCTRLNIISLIAIIAVLLALLAIFITLTK